MRVLSPSNEPFVREERVHRQHRHAVAVANGVHAEPFNQACC